MSSIKDSGGLFTTTNPIFLDALGTLPNFPAFGRGIDGNLTLSSSVNLNTARSGSGLTRTVDSPVATISAISGTALTVTAVGGVIGDFKEDDVCIVINLQGDNTNNGNVGNWELARLASDGAGGSLTLQSALTKVYGVGGNAVLTGQKIVIVRIPEFKNIVINNSGEITASAWNGTWGGLCILMAQSVTCSGTGKISMDAKGYRGGLTNGQTGESVAGFSTGISNFYNGGGGGGAGANGANSSPVSNGPPAIIYGGGAGGAGGGAGGGSGGGGGYGAAGSNGLNGVGGGGGGGAGQFDATNNAVAGSAGSGVTGGGGGAASFGFPAPATPSRQVGSAGASGGTYGNGTSTGGSTVGDVALDKIIFGGGGGAAGLGGTGGTGGNGANGLSAPGAYGGGGGAGGGGGGNSGVGGSAGSPGSGPSGAALAGGNGTSGASGGLGGAAGGTVMLFSKTTTNLAVSVNGTSGAVGGVGGNGGSGVTGTVPIGQSGGFAGAAGAGSGGGGGGAGAGGTALLFSQSLGVSSATSTGGSGGAGGNAGTAGSGSNTPYPPGFESASGGAGVNGNAGANGGVGRVKGVYLKDSSGTYASASADGAGLFTVSDPDGYKESL